jgi:RNA polymerase sigma factor (sigma-70 family)
VNREPSDADSSRTRQAAFEELFQSEYRPIIRRLMALGATLEEAQDCADEAFYEIYRRWEHIERPAAYLQRAATSHFFKARQRDRERPLREAMAAEVIADHDPAAAADFNAWEDQEWITQMLDRLPAAQRQVLALVVSGLQPSEIGVLLGKDAATVRQNLRHARRMLQRVVEQSGGEASS